MILAILPDTSKTESLLNSLSEADFDLNDVSVLMQDIALRNKIAKDVGPLRGTQPGKLAEAVQKQGISADGARRCTDALTNGKIIVAMKVDDKYRKSAEEMFTDHSAELIKD